MVREAARLGSPKLEAVHRDTAVLQYHAVSLWLPDPGGTAVDASKSTRSWNDRAHDDFQHRHVVRHQHRYSALLRRSNVFELQSDLFLHTDVFSVGSNWAVRFGRDHSCIP